MLRKIDRKQCIKCSKSILKRPLRPSEYYMLKEQESFICPSQAITKYYRNLRLKLTKILENALSPEGFRQVLTVEVRKESNGTRFDQESPVWCPHKGHHANWAKRRSA